MRTRLLPILLGQFFLVGCASPQNIQPNNFSVYDAGAEGAVKTALELAAFSLVDDPTLAGIWVLNGALPSSLNSAESQQQKKQLP